MSYLNLTNFLIFQNTKRIASTTNRKKRSVYREFEQTFPNDFSDSPENRAQNSSPSPPSRLTKENNRERPNRFTAGEGVKGTRRRVFAFRETMRNAGEWIALNGGIAYQPPKTANARNYSSVARPIGALSETLISGSVSPPFRNFSDPLVILLRDTGRC